MQTDMQVSEHSGQQSACLQLPVVNSLPEALEGLCEVALFSAQTACFSRSWMTMQPAAQDFTKAPLPRFSGLLIVLRDRAVKQFEAEPSVGRVCQATVLDLAPAIRFEGG